MKAPKCYIYTCIAGPVQYCEYLRLCKDKVVCLTGNRPLYLNCDDLHNNGFVSVIAVSEVYFKESVFQLFTLS